MRGEHERNHAHTLWLQFPWLWAIQSKWRYSWHHDTRVTVSRSAKNVNDFLAESPRDEGQHAYLYISDEMGALVLEVEKVRQEAKEGLTWAPWACCIAPRLDRLIDANAVQAIVDKGPERYTGGCSITIYLPPKSTTLESFIRRALARLEAQSA